MNHPQLLNNRETEATGGAHSATVPPPKTITTLENHATGTLAGGHYVETDAPTSTIATLGNHHTGNLFGSLVTAATGGALLERTVAQTTTIVTTLATGGVPADTAAPNISIACDDCIIHLPSFWPDSIPADKKDQELLQKELEQQYETLDWIPPLLLEEIEACFPSAADIDQQNEGQRCQISFSRKISFFFKICRIFLNYKQFVAAGQFLLDAWAVSSTHSAKSLSCFYSPPLGKEKGKASSTKRLPTASPKQMCCPFRVSLIMRTTVLVEINSNTNHDNHRCQIRYSFLSKKKDDTNFFLKVKVTLVEASHNHALGMPEHRLAKSKSGNCKPNPQAWAFFLHAFRQNPHMNANGIRRLLQDAYPIYKSFTAKAVSNIRRSAYLAPSHPTIII